MKKIILLVIAIAVTIGIAQAAPKKESAKIKVTEFITDLTCENCKKKILNYLPFQKGIKSVDIDMETRIIKVGYLRKKSSDEAIIKLLDKLDVKSAVYDPNAKAIQIAPATHCN